MVATDGCRTRRGRRLAATRLVAIDFGRQSPRHVFLGSGRLLLTSVSARLRLNLLEVRGLPSGDVMLGYGRAA